MAASVAGWVSSKRLCVKTRRPPETQTTIVSNTLDAAEADEKKGRRVYLVTLPHPKRAVSADGRPLVAPGVPFSSHAMMLLTGHRAWRCSALSPLLAVPWVAVAAVSKEGEARARARQTLGSGV